MEAAKVKELITKLSFSQGFYGRLKRDIENSEDPELYYEEIGKGCADNLDVILKIEG